MTPPQNPSARALREQFRDAEQDAGRLRLLASATQAFADDSSAKSALGTALAGAVRFLAADGGLVLVQDGGALNVLAAHGDVLPVGARVPVGGVLAAVLRPPLQASLREHVESRLRLGQRADVAVELLQPLRLGGKAVGLLALLSEHSRMAPLAADLLTLDALGTLIAAAIQSAPRARSPRREAAASMARLTPREQQILALLPRGLSNAQIAAELGIAGGTVKIHIERILHKLGVGDRTQAAVRATEWGLRA